MPLTVKTCLTHRNQNSLLPHQRGQPLSCHLCKLSRQFWWHRAFKKKKLIHEPPLSCVRVILLNMLRIRNSRYPLGDCCFMLIIHREVEGEHLYIIAGCGAKTKPNLSRQNVWSNCVGRVLEFVHPWRCLSEWYVARYTGSVMCSLQLRYQTVSCTAWGSALG